jgi:hypothetical protein
LADGFETRIHADHCRLYKSKDVLFSQLPEETHALLGKPLTTAALTEFCRTDQCELLYLDRLPQTTLKSLVERPQTRAATKAAAAAKAAISNQHADVDSDENDEWGEDDGEAVSIAKPPRVRFQDDSPESASDEATTES